jgi:hypothetical protein
MTLKQFSTGTLTTDALGNASFNADQGTLNLNGKISSILVVLGTATSADVKVSHATYSDIVYLNESNITKTTLFHPRFTARASNGTDFTYDGTQKVPVKPDIVGKINVTISNAGNSKTLTIIVYYE